MSDSLHAVSGRWTLLICERCGLAWPDPRPQPDDFGALYAGYHTHEQAAREPGGILRGLRRGVLRTALGYGSRSANPLASLLSRVPVLRDHAAGRILWIRSIPGGTILDIGCGDGSFLRRMRELGWACSGLDPDGRAAAHLGADPSIRILRETIDDASLAPRSFDVITLIHVLEHVPDPVSTLRACERILKPRGEILVLTPNLDSRGRSRFGRDWRGWECPHHLQVFSSASLVACARAAGLRPFACRVPGQAAWWIWEASSRIRDRRLHRDSSRARRLGFGLERVAESILQASAPWLGAGDELLLRARPGCEPLRPAP